MDKKLRKYIEDIITNFNCLQMADTSDVITQYSLIGKKQIKKEYVSTHSKKYTTLRNFVDTFLNNYFAFIKDYDKLENFVCLGKDIELICYEKYSKEVSKDTDFNLFEYITFCVYDVNSSLFSNSSNQAKSSPQNVIVHLHHLISLKGEESYSSYFENDKTKYREKTNISSGVIKSYFELFNKHESFIMLYLAIKKCNAFNFSINVPFYHFHFNIDGEILKNINSISVILTEDNLNFKTCSTITATYKISNNDCTSGYEPSGVCGLQLITYASIYPFKVLVDEEKEIIDIMLDNIYIPTPNQIIKKYK